MDPCVFCAIAAGAAPSALVYRDPHVVAFLDIHPVARGHTLVVPRTHADRLEDLDPDAGAAMFRVAQRLGRAITRSNLRADGSNLVVNDGRAAFQTVFHVHLHVIPRWERDRVRLATGLLRRRLRDPDTVADAIRTGLDRLTTEEKS